MKNRFNGIDIIKLIALFLVVVVHSIGMVGFNQYSKNTTGD